MLKAKIFFITGVSTSGKTTLIPHLKKALPENFLVYDFDERGVPDNVTEAWRKAETIYWLKAALENAKRNKNTVVCGISIPSEVAENKELLQTIEPRYLLLDVTSSEIRKRLTERLSTPETRQDWARTTGISLEKSIEENIAFAAHLREICREYQCKVVDTAKATPEQTAAEVSDWILSTP